MVELQVDLLHYLRPQALSCVLRGPANSGEASALVALSLYEPLILVSSAEQMQLDGSGLLAAASTAARTLDLEMIPSMMQNSDLRSVRDHSRLLRDCSLWVTIAFISGFNTMAGNFNQRPFLECRLDDLILVERYCNQLLEASPSPWIDQISRLMLLVFRYRSLRQFQEIIQSQFTLLNTLPISPYGPAQACLVEGVSNSFTFAQKALDKLRTIRLNLCGYNN